MRSFSFSDLNRQSGDVLDAALVEPVTLTKRGKPKIVMMSMAEFERLAYPRVYPIDDMPDDIREELLAGLEAAAVKA